MNWKNLRDAKPVLSETCRKALHAAMAMGLDECAGRMAKGGLK